MIICYIGGIGSGKTVSAVREIIDRSSFPITNFKLKNMRGKYHRLKYDDIIISETDKKGNKHPKRVNWEFWDAIRTKYKSFSIYLDEAHNVISSRASMSKRNQLMSQWISQIRKVLSDSGENHIFIITQTPRKLDVNFRELTHMVIDCKKVMVNERCFIKQYYYDGFDGYTFGRSAAKRAFIANKYFKFYDSYEMVKFSDAEDYV